ncbi:uncharacterized protein METZ01_LOCUS499034, partial [marine metagenome]
VKKYIELTTLWVLFGAIFSVVAEASGQDFGEGSYEVGTAMPPEGLGRELVDFTLQQAIDRALESNLNIQTARLSPRMQAFSLQVAR